MSFREICCRKCLLSNQNDIFQLFSLDKDAADHAFCDSAETSSFFFRDLPEAYFPKHSFRSNQKSFIQAFRRELVLDPRYTFSMESNIDSWKYLALFPSLSDSFPWYTHFLLEILKVSWQKGALSALISLELSYKVIIRSKMTPFGHNPGFGSICHASCQTAREKTYPVKVRLICVKWLCLQRVPTPFLYRLPWTEKEVQCRTTLRSVSMH